MLNGLFHIHLELSSKCNKSCKICGRRKIDREYPEIKTNYGFMDFRLLKKISKEIPKNIIISFHNNGEPMIYPNLKESLSLFPARSSKIAVLDTSIR